jgi:hypothetical protein
MTAPKKEAAPKAEAKEKAVDHQDEEDAKSAADESFPVIDFEKAAEEGR